MARRSSSKLLSASSMLFLLLSASVLVGEPAASQPAPKLISQSEVFSYPRGDPYDLQNLYGFNHAPSVVRLPDGRLLAVWFSGPFEASVHQVIQSSSSVDDGTTWSPAEVLQATPRASDFDPAFIADGGQTWFFFTAGRWDRYPFVGPHGPEGEQVGTASFKLWGRCSTDSGHTWSEPRRMYDVPGHGCRSNGIRLSTGELLLPLYSFDAPYVSEVLKSVDNGQTWKIFGKVATTDKIGAGEPTIAELTGGKVLMALRSKDGFLWTSVSPDRGETWSKPRNTGMMAAAASHNLFRMADGRIVLTHDECPASQRSLLTMRVSSDDGATWGAPLALAETKKPEVGEDIWDREVTYPSVTQLPDGTLVVLWAWIEMSPSAQRGVIRSARVSVP
jgi:predicted neuraminidase